MLSLEITEPGSFPVKVDLSTRWDANQTVVIGRGSKAAPSHHISLRKAPNFISRTQFTVRAVDGDPSRLLIRDGGIDEKGEWSPRWKHTFINNVPLSHSDWRAFSLGDRIRMHIDKPSTAGFVIQIAMDSTDGTHSDSRTVSFDIIKVWEAKSRESKKDGVLLLSVPYNNGTAILQKLDSNAEFILGSEPGELIASQGHFIFNNLVAFGEERRRLTEHIAEAAVGNQPIQGDYMFGKNSVNLRLECQPVNNERPLFGWVSLNVKPEPEPLSHQEALLKWANDHPLLAALAGVVVAISFFVIRLLTG